MTDLRSSAAPSARHGAGSCWAIRAEWTPGSSPSPAARLGPRTLPRGDRPQRLISRGPGWRRRSSWPSGSTFPCSSSRPTSWRIRATSATPPIAATSVSRSSGLGFGELAGTRGFDTIIDGTNADDLGRASPGHRARRPSGTSGRHWRSWAGPKQDVRAAARELGLPTWDAPAAPCLSSRVRYGLEITPERLQQVEQGEAFLRSPRRRSVISGSATSVARPDWRLLPDQTGATSRELGLESRAYFERLGFASVELDPDGYRRGGLLSLLLGTARDAALRRGAAPGACTGARCADCWVELRRQRAGRSAGCATKVSTSLSSSSERSLPSASMSSPRRFALRPMGSDTARAAARTNSAPFPSRSRPRVLWVGLEAPPALELLQDRIERRLRGHRLSARRARPFQPHVTLGRVREGQRLPAAVGCEEQARRFEQVSVRGRPSSCCTRAC